MFSVVGLYSNIGESFTDVDHAGTVPDFGVGVLSITKGKVSSKIFYVEMVLSITYDLKILAKEIEYFETTGIPYKKNSKV